MTKGTLSQKALRCVAAALVLALLLVPAGVSPALAGDDYDIWTRDGIPGLLTRGTPGFEDDHAAELVHPIQWNETPWEDEDTWRGEVDGISTNSTATGTIEVEEVFEWLMANMAYIDDIDNYGVAEAWAAPGQTLRKGGGDGADLAFLLASLLKFHTDEVDTDGGDVVYVQCGFLAPPDQGLRFWVSWLEAPSELGQLLDPTGGQMGLLFPPGIATLWVNDEHVFGYLPGYYPLPADPAGGFSREDFSNTTVPLGGGFGDDRNNYAWSMTSLDGDLYVGTARNPGHFMFRAFWPGDVPEGIITQITDPMVDYAHFVDDLQAEIWRYRDGEWELVHQAQPFMIPNPEDGPPDYIPFPEGIGYRIMTTFDGAIYAGIAGLGGAGAMPDVEVPARLLLTSTSGDPGTWEPVNHEGLEGTNTRAMAVHNGKLYVGTSIGDPERAAIFASADPANEGWIKVADFAGTTNTEIISLKSFNGHLYVSTQGDMDFATATMYGFELWRSTVPDPTDPDVLEGGHWTPIVEEGAGDSRNYWGASMEVFNDHLYVGTISLALFGPLLERTFKGFELIRVDKEDNWELVIGHRPGFVGLPNSTTPERGVPISGLPAGFGSTLQFYCWALQEHDGVLYLGTLDLSSLLACIPADMFADALDVPRGAIEQMQEMIAPFAGADLWKTADGINWEPVSIDGFGNPCNYGVRTMVAGNSLYVGTGNPYVGEGCEVWVAQVVEPEPPAVTTLAAAGVTDSAATLRGHLPGLGDYTQVRVRFQWGTTTAYGNDTPWQTMTAAGAFNVPIADLAPETGYHFRAQVQTVSPANTITVSGDDMTFTTEEAFDPPVGGTVYPANVLGILAPWVALGAAVIAGVGLLAVRRRRAQS